MQLLPDDLRAQIPKLSSQEKIKTDEKQVYAKFFFLDADWTWFVFEGEPEDRDFVFFGYINAFDVKFGYFTLSELEHISVNGMVVERDLNFKTGMFCDVIAQYRRERSR